MSHRRSSRRSARPSRLRAAALVAATLLPAGARADDIAPATWADAPVASPAPRGSVAHATAKVRELSAFAAEHGRPAAAPAAADRPPMDREDPGSGYALVAWNTEPAAAPAAAAPQAFAPTATPAPTTVAPWLDSVATRPAAAPAPATPMPAPAPVMPSAAPAVPYPVAAPPATPYAQPYAQPAAQPYAQPAAPPAAAQPLPAPAQPAAPPPKTGTAAFIAAFQKPFSIFTKPAAPPKAAPAQPAQPASPPATPPAASPAAMAVQQPAPPAPAGADLHGSMPLGLEGYCPVALVDRGTWTEGRAQWGARHRGRTYLFAGADEQRAFLANPDRYAPALSGDDPVLAFDRGSSTPGQRRYGVTYQARVYLFASPETLAAFSADPARYATRIAMAERTPSPAGAPRTY